MSRATPDPARRAAFAAGAFYLLTFISSVPAALLLGPAQDDPTLLISVSDGVVRVAAVLELVNALACIATAVAVFSVVKREHESLALGFVTTRMFEAATLVGGIVALLAAVTVHQAVAPGDPTRASTEHALVAIRFWTVIIGPGMAAFNALMFGTLLYRSRLVPRAIPALGIVGAPVLIAYVVGTILGVTAPGDVWQGVAVLPFFTWELVIGLWMTFRGFDRTAPILNRAEARDSASVTRSALASTGGVA